MVPTGPLIVCEPRQASGEPANSARLLRSALPSAIGGAGHRFERGGDDVRVDADAEEGGVAGGADLDIGGGLGVGAGADRMLAIVERRQLERRTGRAARRQRRRSGRCRRPRCAARRRRPPPSRRSGAAPARAARAACCNRPERCRSATEIGVLEQRPDVGAGQSPCRCGRSTSWTTPGKLDLQAARQVEPVIGLAAHRRRRPCRTGC